MKKKVFISVPMKGRTNEAIAESIKQMHKIAEIIFGEELEPIHNFYEHTIPQCANGSIYCLGFAVQNLAFADYFIGVNYTTAFRGCNIEHNIAHAYGIKSYTVNISVSDIFKDAMEIERKECENRCYDDAPVR